MKSRPACLTDELLALLDGLSFQEMSDCVMWAMRTFAERHNLNQADIDEHKRILEKLRPQNLKAELLRLEILLKRAKNDYQELENTYMRTKAALDGTLEGEAT